MSKPRLHLDADISIKALQVALTAYGHDVSRTPNAWVTDDASDETQLLAATSQGRCVITYNVGDFVRLARRIPDHGGIHPGHAPQLDALRADPGARPPALDHPGRGVGRPGALAERMAGMSLCRTEIRR